MKIALAHDWLNQKKGGAERVVFALARTYPGAVIHTLIFNRAKFQAELGGRGVKTSFLQWLPAILKRNPRYLLPLIPLATRQLKPRAADVLLSSSAAFAKNIPTPKGTLHICYCHTPMRFGWDYRAQYLKEQRVGRIQALLARLMMAYIRRWDRRGSRGVDHFIANSETVAGRIKRYYGREAKVIYPPVDTKRFRPLKKSDHYITLSMLTPYKKLDLVVEAFNQSGRKLLVLGEGLERTRLEQLAKPNVEFKGYVTDSEKANLLGRARGLIFPSEEDFGIAMVEALAAGTPVVAFGRGGATEILTPETGVLFDEQTPAALNAALERFEAVEFNTSALTARATRFSQANFNRAIQRTVKEYYRAHVEAN